MTDSIDSENSSAQSLNSGSDYKEIHCLQQQSVAKISRGELEDLYYQLHDENIEIKKKFNSLDNKYKIMATRVMRLSREHKCVESIDREEDQRQLQQLRQNETALNAKLTVLRGQLASHTRLHSAALSKVQRPRAHRCSRICHSGRGNCGKDDDSILAISRPGSQSRGQSRQRSSSLTGSQQGAPKDQHGLAKTNAGLQDEITHLQNKISTLQRDVLLASEKSNTRICELETELAKHLDKDTAENVELIKARRLSKQHETALISLQQEQQMTQRELQACKAALTLAARDQDELCSTLMKERQKNTDLHQENVKLSQTCSSIRDLEEQLKDAKKENAVLKEHSNRLLQLKTGIADARSSPWSDFNEVHVVAPTTSENPSVMPENNDLKQKLASLKQEQLNLQHEIKEIQDEISVLNKKLLQAKDERNNLNEEHAKALGECLKLRTELIEPQEERKRLFQQLSDIRNESACLVEDLSKSKSKLEQQKRDQQDLQLAVQEQRATNALKKDESNERTGLNYSHPFASIPNRQLFHAPQLSSGSSYFLSAPQSHSHPCTPRPRPRAGDACLALLEQTAIRPSSSSFHGVLGSHGSLQERFLELCIPNSPISSSSTLVQPVSTEEIASNLPVSEDARETQSIPVSPKIRSSSYSHQHNGQTDTQRELDKCREVLRVQFNLNSIYKKEVASLSNIVQSLTSGTRTQDDSSQ